MYHVRWLRIVALRKVHQVVIAKCLHGNGSSKKSTNNGFSTVKPQIQFNNHPTTLLIICLSRRTHDPEQVSGPQVPPWNRKGATSVSGAAAPDVATIQAAGFHAWVLPAGGKQRTSPVGLFRWGVPDTARPRRNPPAGSCCKIAITWWSALHFVRGDNRIFFHFPVQR